MGETDNKKALDQRKKQLLKEKRKYGLAEEEETQLSWESYYSKVFYTFVFLQIFHQGSSIHLPDEGGGYIYLILYIRNIWMTP